KAAGLAITAFWIGSNYAYYYFREPMMIHVVSAFWVVANIATVAQMVPLLRQGRVPAGLIFLWVFSGTMAVLCRPTNAFLAIFAIHALIEIGRAGKLRRLFLLTPVTLLALV